MLFQCCQDDRTIDIPFGMYIHINDYELNRLCTEGNGCHVEDPWYSSNLSSRGVVLTPEQVEEIEEQEYIEEEIQPSCDLNLDPDYWE